MRAVQALTAGIRAGAALPPIPVAATLPRQADPATVEVVNRLFVELQAIFPAWRQAWPDDKALAAAKRSWIKGFAAAGITSLEQIRFGLEQCRLYGGDFIPSVGKFIAWCRPTPESLGFRQGSQNYVLYRRLLDGPRDPSGALGGLFLGFGGLVAHGAASSASWAVSAGASGS